MWYGKAPIGEKALQQMMANISGIFDHHHQNHHSHHEHLIFVGNTSMIVFQQKSIDSCQKFTQIDLES
jgi:hypothetical protein